MGGYINNLDGKPTRSIINGTILRGDELTIETGDGYAIRYRHMPPASYSHFKTGDKISTNDIVGTVGGWGRGGPKSLPPHIHFEVLKKSIDPKTKKEGYFTSLDASQVTIKGGKIYEK
jgi:murein DD-endopeptidase MepM/ murein hydrolase activator NlpD